MAISHKSAISFGLVHIPVSLYTATHENTISFNQLHKKCNSRIKYKKFCPVCNREISSDEIIKGYQYKKDTYVIIDDEDFEKIKTEKDKSIQIIHFANTSEIQPIYYDKSYYVMPDAGGDKAFELFRYAMENENKIAIAKTVLGTKEALLAIMPSKGNIIIETLYYYDEIKELPRSYNKVSLNQDEVSMAKTLINAMTKPFEPDLYYDEYQMRLREAIEKKISGDEITPATQPEQKGVIDLMEALKMSIEQQNTDNVAGKQNKTNKKRVTKKRKTIDFNKKSDEIGIR
jgi:DNA end-binding protein Ku